MVAPALWAVAHPDDETLLAAVSIAEHVAAGQNINILLMTDGGSSSVINSLNGLTNSSWWGVPHNPTMEGYATLTTQDFEDARVNEFKNACACLASGFTGTLTLYYANLIDGSVNITDAKDAIMAICDQIAPNGTPVRLKGHSWLVDNHPDHIATGGAIKSLVAENPVRFIDPRYYIEQPYWTDSRLSQVTESWDLPTDGTISARAKNAYRSYGAWSPLSGSFAIGYHSISSEFDALMANPKAMVHL